MAEFGNLRYAQIISDLNMSAPNISSGEPLAIRAALRSQRTNTEPVSASAPRTCSIRSPKQVEYSDCDGYDALGCLPDGRRERGKGSEANRNDGLRAKLRTRLNRLGRATSGYTKKLEMLANSLALVWLRERLI